MQKYFCKKACLRVFNTLMISFESFIEVLKVRICSPGSNCFLWTILSGSANYVLMKLSDMPIINSVFQNKS